MEYLAMMGHNALDALIIMANPMRLFFLFGGVVIGLVLGILPGIGGIAGTALLLPFTFNMDPVRRHGAAPGSRLHDGDAADPIPAILFGVPGGAGSAATVLDGLPMAQARRSQPRAIGGLSYVVDAGRRLRRHPDGRIAADPSADHALYWLAGTAVFRGARHLDGRRALRQYADARPHCRGAGPAHLDGRLGPADGHPSLDARFA